MRLSGSALQILAAATGKARLPTVESLKDGTTRRLVPEERRERRPDTSAMRLSGPRYWDIYTDHAEDVATLLIPPKFLLYNPYAVRSVGYLYAAGIVYSSYFAELFLNLPTES